MYKRGGTFEFSSNFFEFNILVSFPCSWRVQPACYLLPTISCAATFVVVRKIAAVTGREIKKNDLKMLAAAVAALIGSCWNSLTRPDKILTDRKWFSPRTWKSSFAARRRANGGAIFGLSHVALAGTFNLGMTLYHDLSAGIRKVLEYSRIYGLSGLSARINFHTSEFGFPYLNSKILI